MKVGDLVFSNGMIAIIVDVYDWKHIGESLGREKRFLKLYYFGDGCFGNTHIWSVVPVSDDIR